MRKYSTFLLTILLSQIYIILILAQRDSSKCSADNQRSEVYLFVTFTHFTKNPKALFQPKEHKFTSRKKISIRPQKPISKLVFKVLAIPSSNKGPHKSKLKYSNGLGKKILLLVILRTLSIITIQDKKRNFNANKYGKERENLQIPTVLKN